MKRAIAILLVLAAIFSAPWPSTSFAADAGSLASLQEISEQIIGSPESELYDDELYIAILEHLAALSSLPADLRMRVEFELSMHRRNRVGTPATDFSFRTAAGEQTLFNTLHRPTILLLYDPECGHCLEVITELSSDELLAARIDAGELDVLAICIDGTDDQWASVSTLLPASWISGRDTSDIVATDLYYIQTTPTLYLLAPDATILLKNTTPAALRSHLQ